MDKSLSYLNVHKKEHIANKKVPPMASVIIDHSLAHMKAELKWLKDLRKRIATGELP